MGQEENIVELKISQADLGHLKELLSSLVLGQHTPAGDAAGEVDAWLKARIVLESRRRRAEFFAPSMFGEAPWDILLTLFTAGESSFGISVNRLAEASGVPASSCKRWLDYLEQERLVVRRRHSTDQRLSLVMLSPQGKDRMRQYFETLDG